MCVQNATSSVNTRLVFYALPEGTPPPGGWPIYALFQPWQTVAPSGSPSCGPLYPPFVVQSCVALMRERCPDNTDLEACSNCTRALRRSDAAAYEAANCSSAQTNQLWCRQQGQQRSRLHENRPPFQEPASVLAPCIAANGSWDPEGQMINGTRTSGKQYGPGVTRCSFGAVNGRVWAQRLNQFLLANGIAIVQINPAQGDSWVGSAYTTSAWQQGDDRPFLQTLFGQMHSGEFGGLGAGVLNPHRLSVSGYSVGAQMVSWMIQVQATGEMTEQLNATVKAGAFFAGGTCAPLPHALLALPAALLPSPSPLLSTGLPAG